MDQLGDRMKGYEGAWGSVLPERTPVIVRVDGKAFHTATRGLKKPVDERVSMSMKLTALALLKNMQNAVLAYQQSDEISILMINYQGQFTQSWYGNKVQKIVSVAAALATREFNSCIQDDSELAVREWLFDARAFSLPREEVRNYFVWRQMDAMRNSVSNLGRCYFSQKELNGKPSKEVVEMLRKIGVNWDSMRSQDRMGAVIVRDSSEEDNYRLIGDTPNFVSDKTFFQPFVNPPTEVELAQEVTGS
jgi:tRNA(His) guanylyltransferase